MRVILAPMQGVLDFPMRHLLTQFNQYDYCVSEFVRVVDQRLPARVFYRICPELHQQGKTSSGTPVRVQLLGQHPQYLAENAQQAVELGSFGIDLNCGCPSKTVNGSQGWAALLKEPELIYQATVALRQAVPIYLPVSVKIRLGWQDATHTHEIADAVAQGGATELVVHARTKQDGYQADKINWAKIKELQAKILIPMIANGEIWNADDAARCQQQSGCCDFMVARGALSCLNLGLCLKQGAKKMSWAEVYPVVLAYIQPILSYSRFYPVSRLKQWLRYLAREYPQAQKLFDHIKTCHNGKLLPQLLLEFEGMNHV